MKITMRFEGGEELAEALAGLSLRMTKSVLMEALTDAAEPMRAAMGRLAPREPGAPDIADNMVISSTRTKAAEIKVGPAKGFYYGFFLEYGTAKMSARPFMRPAFDGTAERALDILRASLWTILASKGIGRTVSAPTRITSPGALL